MLAQRWTENALAEHASIASFSKFMLDLMSLGAHAELLEKTNQSLLEEIEHARASFAIASQLHGHCVGAGPLPVHSVTVDGDVVRIASELFEEACVGETLSAACVFEAASQCKDVVLASVLEQIAEDEMGHAHG